MNDLIDSFIGRGFIPVAARKAAELMYRNDFKGVKTSDENGVILRFIDQYCTVDKFGKCTWQDD